MENLDFNFCVGENVGAATNVIIDHRLHESSGISNVGGNVMLVPK